MLLNELVKIKISISIRVNFQPHFYWRKALQIFESIPKEAIFPNLKEPQRLWYRSDDLDDEPLVTIILTDGSTLFAPASKIFKLQDSLLLTTGEQFEEYRYELSFNQIAGITEFVYHQTKKEWTGRDEPIPTRPPAIYHATKEYDRFVREQGKYIPFVQQMQMQQQQQQCRVFGFGDLSFTQYTPTYADWDFLSQKEGGITSLGAGPLGSLGWKESPWNTLQKQLKRKKFSFEEVARSHNFVVSGHVNFLVGETVTTISMEGEDWHPFLLTSFRFKPSEIPCAWLLVYFRKRCCLVPSDMWENATQPITFGGEFIQQSVLTEFGSARGFCKLRAGAYVPN